MNSNGGQDYNKPVAYDEQGRPLYAHPPASQSTNNGSGQNGSKSPQVVYLTRAIDPHRQEISAEIRQKHDESVYKYPQLNLSVGEYVISAVKRHPIGLISIWVVVLLAVFMILAIPAVLFTTGSVPFQLPSGAAVNGSVLLFLMVLVLVLGGVVATIVYQANRFYLTNESVTQCIQNGLFSKKSQTISLGNIEDASFRQKGILQTILNYGSLRLSTEGDETTYRFSYVANPERQTQLLNNAIESFKNFRPMNDEDQ